MPQNPRRRKYVLASGRAAEPPTTQINEDDVLTVTATSGSFNLKASDEVLPGDDGHALFMCGTISVPK